MRLEKLYLLDILEAADVVRRFCEPVSIVWATAVHDVPELRAKILKILDEEYQGE